MSAESQFRRSLPPGKIYRNRLQYEMDLIDQFHFKPIFDQVRAILDLSQDVPHLTRGSAGGSLICYLLGITDFDPIVHQFALSRFMHPFRPDPPDIDLDFPYNRRDEVLERIFQKYPGRVARISNKVTHHRRGAIRQALREYGGKRRIPRYFNFADYAGLFPAEIEARTASLIGTQKHFAKHSGGIVVFEDAVPEELKLTETQIKLDKDETEAAGLIKIDILCNRGLAQLVELSSKSVMDYPEEDELTARIFQRGDTWGITFAESPAQQKLSAGLQPRCRADVVLALALIRPVPSADGRKLEALRQWQQYRHTKGHLITDEDGIYLIQDLLGCSEPQAEIYRKAFAKGNLGVMQEFAQQISHRPDMMDIVTRLSYYRLYSFCRAHATAYGYLVWALAYEKARQPHQFWLTALNHLASQYRPWVHVQEAKQAGLTFVNFGRPPWRLHRAQLVSTRPDAGVTDGWAQYRQRKYWTSNRFMPGMYYSEKGGRVNFRVLIGTGRHHTVGGRAITFITGGYATGKYVSLIFHDLLEYDRWDIVTGEGTLQHGDVVVSIYTLSLAEK